MKKNYNILFFAFLALFFLSCEKAPKPFVTSEDQLTGKYRLTFEAVYTLSVYVDNINGEDVERIPKNVKYHSVDYNFLNYSDGSVNNNIDISKFKVILKPNKEVEFSDIDNQEVDLVGEPIYSPRFGTWRYTGGNTFVIHLNQTNKTAASTTNTFPEAEMFCEITSTGRENGDIYYMVKARSGEQVLIVKEFKMVKDDSVIEELN